MASSIRIATRRNLPSFCSNILLTNGIRPTNSNNRILQSREVFSVRNFQSRPYTSCKITRSPFEANILRLVRKEIDYQLDYAPPHQPDTKIGLFTVQDRPGEQWMTMSGKFCDKEEIKLEVTMFDGYKTIPKIVDGDESLTDDVRLHLSVLVGIVKKDCDETLEFLCSAWPDCLEIQKVYVFRPASVSTMPFMGRNFRELGHKLQEQFRDYLNMRGVNDTLSRFLHEYMMNKDRIELIRWYDKLKSFVDK